MTTASWTCRALSLEARFRLVDSARRPARTGSLCTYEPQWGSDVFGMYQSLVEGREVPWSLCVKDVPEDKKYDLDYIIDQLDWEKNVDTHFKAHTYLEPIVADQGKGWVDKWIVYGTIDGKQLFSSKELTVEPRASNH